MENQKICSECGGQLEQGEEICYQCGLRLAPKKAEEAPAPVEVKSGKPNSKAIMVGVLILVVSVAVGGIYFYLNKDKPNNGNSSVNSGQNSNSQKAIENKPVDTASKELTKEQFDLTNGASYIPAINKKYTYHYNYVGGEQLIYPMTVGKTDGAPIVTMINLIPQSEAYALHVVKRGDGYYVISDDDPSEASPYLPEKTIEGTSWAVAGVNIEIERVNQICNVGFGKFDNCLVVRRDYPEEEYSFRIWYAPGVGEVKSVYADSNYSYGDLKSIEDVSEKEVRGMIKKYSPNIDKIK